MTDAFLMRSGGYPVRPPVSPTAYMRFPLCGPHRRMEGHASEMQLTQS